MSALDSNLYTANSFALLLTSVEAGEAVVNDDNVDADDMNGAVLDIQTAYADLEKLSASDDNSGNPGSSSGTSSRPSGTYTTGMNATSSQIGKNVDIFPFYIYFLKIS